MRLWDLAYLDKHEVRGWAPILGGVEGLLLWEGAGRFGTFSMSRWHKRIFVVFVDKAPAEKRASMHPNGRVLEVRLRRGLRVGLTRQGEKAIRGDEFLIIKKKEEKVEFKRERTKTVRPAKNRR